MIRRFAAQIVAYMLLVGLNAADAQDFGKGLAAARAGDFAAAISEWRPLADDGHAEAQFNLGALYEAGLGVPEDLAEAAGWYALARWKYSSPQYSATWITTAASTSTISTRWCSP